MNANNTKTFFLIGKIINIINIVTLFIIGLLTIVTIVGIIPITLASFLIYAQIKMDEITKLNIPQMQNCIKEKKHFGWAIFLTIANFPLGLLFILPFVMENNSTNTNCNNNQSQNKQNMDENFSDALKKLHEQKENGIITEEEFAILKAKIIKNAFEPNTQNQSNSEPEIIVDDESNNDDGEDWG